MVTSLPHVKTPRLNQPQCTDAFAEQGRIRTHTHQSARTIFVDGMCMVSLQPFDPRACHARVSICNKLVEQNPLLSRSVYVRIRFKTVGLTIPYINVLCFRIA